MIVVLEFIKAVQGKAEELKQAILEIVPLSRRAPGCLQYDLLEPLKETGEFFVFMRWNSLKDLQKHESSVYIAEFVKKHERALYEEVSSTEWKISS